MTTRSTTRANIGAKTGIDGPRLELAAAISALCRLQLIAEENDPDGTPRFRPTGRQPSPKSVGPARIKEA